MHPADFAKQGKRGVLNNSITISSGGKIPCTVGVADFSIGCCFINRVAIVEIIIKGTSAGADCIFGFDSCIAVLNISWIRKCYCNWYERGIVIKFVYIHSWDMV